MALNGSKVLAVDWDGTCVEQRWPEEGDWLPGAKEALWVLSQKWDVYIWTCRLAPYERDNWGQRVPPHKTEREYAYIRRMLDAANLTNVRIFMGEGKIGAQAYIDDKAIRFTGQWADTVARVALHCG